MREVGIRALKQNASAVVAQVAGGETVTVTDRGYPVARMVPIQGSKLETLVSSGRARLPLSSLTDVPPPRRRAKGARSLSEELALMRQSERD